MRPVINTKKHIVQYSLFTVAGGALETKTIAVTVAVPDGTPTQIKEGSKVSAVYVEMWISSDDDVTPGTAILTLVKIPGAGQAMQAGESAALDSYDNKKNVFHIQMGLTPDKNTYPLASIKGWFKIPKSKQRFGLLDQLHLNLHGQSNGLNACGFALFKEQY